MLYLAVDRHLDLDVDEVSKLAHLAATRGIYA